MRSFNHIATLIKVKRAVHPKGYSPTEVAHLVGLNCDKLITDIENATCSVPLKMMPKLSYALNIHPNEFIEAVMKDHEESLDRYFNKKFKEKTIYM